MKTLAIILSLLAPAALADNGPPRWSLLQYTFAAGATEPKRKVLVDHVPSRDECIFAVGYLAKIAQDGIAGKLYVNPGPSGRNEHVVVNEDGETAVLVVSEKLMVSFQCVYIQPEA